MQTRASMVKSTAMAGHAERMRTVRTLRALLVAISAASVLFGGSPARAGAPDAITSLLKTKVENRSCSAHDRAIEGTLHRLNAVDIPLTGRVILVNIASRTLAAYEDGVPIVESRVVIGREGWKTPDLSTSVDYVRLNPTWTVPESIVRENRWRSKLASNPGWFARNGFEVAVRGRTYDPRDVDPDAANEVTFVQKPGRLNALGMIKVGLVNSGGIYLHDTNDPAAYDRRGVESHGCIRVEGIFDLAGWILGKDPEDVRDLIAQDDRTNRKPATPVKVVVGYFTAWPDAEGRVHFYNDIYGRDPRPGASCRPDVRSVSSGDDDVMEMPYGAGPVSPREEDEPWIGD